MCFIKHMKRKWIKWIKMDSERYTFRQTETETGRQTDRYIDIPINKDKQIDAEEQTVKQTNAETETNYQTIKLKRKLQNKRKYQSKSEGETNEGENRRNYDQKTKLKPQPLEPESGSCPHLTPTFLAPCPNAVIKQ